MVLYYSPKITKRQLQAKRRWQVAQIGYGGSAFSFWWGLQGIGSQILSEQMIIPMRMGQLKCHFCISLLMFDQHKEEWTTRP